MNDDYNTYQNMKDPLVHKNSNNINNQIEKSYKKERGTSQTYIYYRDILYLVILIIFFLYIDIFLILSFYIDPIGISFSVLITSFFLIKFIQRAKTTVFS